MLLSSILRTWRRSVVGVAAVTGLFLSAGAVSGTSVGARSPATEAARDPGEKHRGFTLAAGSCEQGPAFCALATPRPWTPDERALVGDSLDEIWRSESGRRVAQQAVRNGFQVIRRFTASAQSDSEGHFEIEPLTVASLHKDDRHSIRSVDVTDQFFLRRSARDQFSGTVGYRLTTEILLHELMHAVDLDQQYSASMDFRRVAALWVSLRRPQSVEDTNRDRIQLNADGRYEDSWRVSRFFGVTTMRGRLPSVQALDSYREAFAEFGAHLILDPNSRRRFDPRLVHYLDSLLQSLR